MTAYELSSINKANAAHSTGPKTPEGKQRAAMNALKHGLTGQRLILQPDEHEAYRDLTESLHAELQPKTTLELQMVQKIIDTHMRLNRVAVLDNNMLNFGLIENCHDVKDGGAEDDETETAHAQVRSWIAHQMSFERLGRYEGRLSRQLIACTKELERLQAVRIEKERAQANQRILEFRSQRASALRGLAQAAAANAQPAESRPAIPQTPPQPASFGIEPAATLTATDRPPADPAQPLAA